MLSFGGVGPAFMAHLHAFAPARFARLAPAAPALTTHCARVHIQSAAHLLGQGHVLLAQEHTQVDAVSRWACHSSLVRSRPNSSGAAHFVPPPSCAPETLPKIIRSICRIAGSVRALVYSVVALRGASAKDGQRPQKCLMPFRWSASRSVGETVSTDGAKRVQSQGRVGQVNIAIRREGRAGYVRQASERAKRAQRLRSYRIRSCPAPLSAPRIGTATNLSPLHRRFYHGPLGYLSTSSGGARSMHTPLCAPGC